VDRVLAGASGKGPAVAGPIETKSLAAAALAGVRIGVPKSSLWAGVDPAVAAAAQASSGERILPTLP